jgi:Flp pilus assembly protein TadD
MPEPLAFLGEIQLRRGDAELALETIERAIAADPEYFEAYYHLAQVQRRLGRADEARAALIRYEDLKKKKRGVLSQEEVLALR